MLAQNIIILVGADIINGYYLAHRLPYLNMLSCLLIKYIYKILKMEFVKNLCSFMGPDFTAIQKDGFLQVCRIGES